MNMLIIEDEHFAAKRIESLVKEHLPEAKVLEVIDTVEEAVAWFSSHVEPQLVFMDIQLADGLSFQIFEKVKIHCPVIFTTAYDEYALDAFKVNSIDYILKPIESAAFKRAIDKYQKIYSNDLDKINWKNLTHDIFNAKESYKKRFLVKSGQSYSYLNTSDIKLFYSEDGLTFALNESNRRIMLDSTLDKIESQLDPSIFFRINRKFIIPLDNIKKIHPYLNSRLKLELNSEFTEDIIVSREKVKAFKDWIDS